MPQIEINYLNPTKPKGVVGGLISIPLNTQFTFFSHDGPVHIQFVESAPFPEGLGPGGTPGPRFPGDHNFHASIPGVHKFKCFFHIGNLPDIELDPTRLGGIGGEIVVGNVG